MSERGRRPEQPSRAKRFLDVFQRGPKSPRGEKHPRSKKEDAAVSPAAETAAYSKEHALTPEQELQAMQEFFAAKGLKAADVTAYDRDAYNFENDDSLDDATRELLRGVQKDAKQWSEQYINPDDPKDHRKVSFTDQMNDRQAERDPLTALRMARVRDRFETGASEPEVPAAKAAPEKKGAATTVFQETTPASARAEAEASVDRSFGVAPETARALAQESEADVEAFAGDAADATVELAPDEDTVKTLVHRISTEASAPLSETTQHSQQLAREVVAAAQESAQSPSEKKLKYARGAEEALFPLDADGQLIDSSVPTEVADADLEDLTHEVEEVEQEDAEAISASEVVFSDRVRDEVMRFLRRFEVNEASLRNEDFEHLSQLFDSEDDDVYELVPEEDMNEGIVNRERLIQLVRQLVQDVWSNTSHLSFEEQDEREARILQAGQDMAVLRDTLEAPLVSEEDENDEPFSTVEQMDYLFLRAQESVSKFVHAAPDVLASAWKKTKNASKTYAGRPALKFLNATVGRGARGIFHAAKRGIEGVNAWQDAREQRTRQRTIENNLDRSLATPAESESVTQVEVPSQTEGERRKRVDARQKLEALRKRKEEASPRRAAERRAQLEYIAVLDEQLKNLSS